MPGAATHLQTLFEVGSFAGQPDGALLDRFLGGPREAAEAAFAAIVQRHGPMVLRTCRQLTGDPHDADDAAQATFLVLARRARSVRSSDSLAAWLHGVARRVSLRARADASRRRAREARAAHGPAPATPPEPEGWPEVHEELSRLPDRYRLPLVLCHLEGLTHEQAAHQLRCPVRTLQTRLARGRDRLRSSLSRRGLGPAAALLGTASIPEIASAAWTSGLTRAAYGGTTASVPAAINALVKGTTKTMLLTQWKGFASAAAILILAACGVGVRAQMPTAPSTTPTAPPAPAANPYRVTTSNGITVEVVGVSPEPSGPTTWRKPDGSPLEPAPLEPSRGVIAHYDGELAWEFAVRCSASGKGVEPLIGLDVDSSTKTGYGNASLGGQSLPGLSMVNALLPASLETATIRWRVATGPWTPYPGGTTDGKRRTGTRDGQVFFSKGSEVDGHASIVVVDSFSANIPGSVVRVAAIDRDGNPHELAHGGRSGNPGGVRVHDGEFNLPLKEVREFQIQTRPFESIEIKGIALHPRPASK